MDCGSTQPPENFDFSRQEFAPLHTKKLWFCCRIICCKRQCLKNIHISNLKSWVFPYSVVFLLTWCWRPPRPRPAPGGGAFVRCAALRASSRISSGAGRGCQLGPSCDLIGM